MNEILAIPRYLLWQKAFSCLRREAASGFSIGAASAAWASTFCLLTLVDDRVPVLHFLFLSRGALHRLSGMVLWRTGLSPGKEDQILIVFHLPSAQNQVISPVAIRLEAP